MTCVYATVKKVTSTQKPDQSGSLVQHVQVLLEFEASHDGAVVGELSALQRTVLVRATFEPHALRPSPDGSGDELPV